jgi:hypothetical protein
VARLTRFAQRGAGDLAEARTGRPSAAVPLLHRQGKACRRRSDPAEGERAIGWKSPALLDPEGGKGLILGVRGTCAATTYRRVPGIGRFPLQHGVEAMPLQDVGRELLAEA